MAAAAAAAAAAATPDKQRAASGDTDDASSLASCSVSVGGGQVLVLTIKPSSWWNTVDLEALSSLADGPANQFVCMQLITMVREQAALVAAAAAAGASAQLWRARFVLLATCSDVANGRVMGAALFYPRSGSSCKGAAAAVPHVYLELLVCNSPGRGVGALLLQHIEQFVCAARDELSLGLVDAGAGEAAAAMNRGAGGGDGGTHAPLPPLSARAGGAPDCCSACNATDGCPAAAVAACEAACPGSPCGSSVSSGSAFGSPPPSGSGIQGIRLLSVQRAHTFYVRHGYNAPPADDDSKELFKPLHACACGDASDLRR